MFFPKICFFSLASYPYLTQKDTGTAGGAELVQVLIAVELVRQKFDISFIVDDYGQNDVVTVEAIKIFKSPSSRFNKVIYFPTRVYHLWKTLKRVNADIYYQRSARAETGIIALFCILNNKKFIYGIASDMEVNGIFIKTAKFYERILFGFGLRNADVIIVQSQYQQSLLKKNLNLDSILIKTPHPVDENIIVAKCSPPVVLWVGTVKPEWKQPDLFLELAKSIPQARFQMIGGAGNKKYYEMIKEQAKKIPNLEFVGFVPYRDINQYFNDASILVNTSTVEGFSNTFLQAWAGYTPVVSLNADPDEIICKYKLGFHSRTFEKMVADVKILLDDKMMREEMGMNGRRYVVREHDLKTIVGEYVGVIDGR